MSCCKGYEENPTFTAEIVRRPELVLLSAQGDCAVRPDREKTLREWGGEGRNLFLFGSWLPPVPAARRAETNSLQAMMRYSAQLGALPRMAAPEKAMGPVHSGTRKPRSGWEAGPAFLV